MIKAFLIWSFFIAHPVHVSLLSVDYSPEELSINAYLKIYFDDFILDAAQILNNEKGFVLTENEVPEEALILKYLGEKLNIYVNDQRMNGKLRKVSLENNELSLNLKYETSNTINTLTIKNHIMTDLYEDQANMVIVRINDFEEGIKLTSCQTEQTFSFK